MTTKVNGYSYSGPIDEVLNNRPRSYALGNVGSTNLRVILQDTNEGTYWKLPGPRAFIFLYEGNRSMPVVAREDVFRGEEGQTLIFENPVYRGNRIEVTFSKERK